MNSGRFANGLKLLMNGGSAFNHFLNFSDWLWQTTGKTHEFALEKLVDLLFDYLRSVSGLPVEVLQGALLADYVASGARARPHCIEELLARRHSPQPARSISSRADRQSRHIDQQHKPNRQVPGSPAAH